MLQSQPFGLQFFTDCDMIWPIPDSDRRGTAGLLGTIGVTGPDSAGVA